MKSPLPLLLIMSSVLFSQPANFQKPSFNNSNHSQPFNKSEKVKYELKGLITVFYKQVQSDGTKVKEFNSILEITESDASYSSKIENKRSDIRPWDTDSILVNEKMGYPSTSEKTWYFEREQGRITTYSAHPEYELGLKFKIDNSKLEPVPLKLRTTSKASGLTAIHAKFAFADSIAQNPRVFADFQYRPKQMLTLFNTLPDSLLFSALGQDTIANLTRELFELSEKKLKAEKIDELLVRDPQNSLAYIRKAELLLKQKNTTEAKKLLAIAQKHTPFDDFHIHRVTAILHELEGDDDAAIESYTQALKLISWYSSNFRKRYEKDLHKKIEKLY